jgi:hypothetical protein
LENFLRVLSAVEQVQFSSTLPHLSSHLHIKAFSKSANMAPALADPALATAINNTATKTKTIF